MKYNNDRVTRSVCVSRVSSLTQFPEAADARRISHTRRALCRAFSPLSRCHSYDTITIQICTSSLRVFTTATCDNKSRRKS